jgi:hypothetical protein
MSLSLAVWPTNVLSAKRGAAFRGKHALKLKPAGFFALQRSRPEASRPNFIAQPYSSRTPMTQ